MNHVKVYVVLSVSDTFVIFSSFSSLSLIDPETDAIVSLLDGVSDAVRSSLMKISY